MKERYELNARLYAQKMDERMMPRRREELAQYRSIVEGDTDEVRRQLSIGELRCISSSRILSVHEDRNMLYHFIVSASSLAQACMEGGLSHDEAYTLSDIYIRKADLLSSLACIHDLFAEMCFDFTQRMGEIKKKAAVSLHIRKCISHIYENLGGDLSVNKLSQITGLNPSYLSRLFSSETGKTIKRFILEAKIDTAENLLRYSDLSCSRISASLGFSSQSAFIAVFKKITGHTPAAWRNLYCP